MKHELLLVLIHVRSSSSVLCWVHDVAVAVQGQPDGGQAVMSKAVLKGFQEGAERSIVTRSVVHMNLRSHTPHMKRVPESGLQAVGLISRGRHDRDERPLPRVIRWLRVGE